MVLPGIPRGPQPEHRARGVLQQQHREPDARIHRRRVPEGVPHGMDAQPRRTGHRAGIGEEQDRRLRRFSVVLQSGARRVLLAGSVPAPGTTSRPSSCSRPPGRRRCRAGSCSKPASRTCAAAGPYPSPGDGEFASVPGAIHTRGADHRIPVERAELLRRRDQGSTATRSGPRCPTSPDRTPSRPGSNWSTASPSSSTTCTATCGYYLRNGAPSRDPPARRRTPTPGRST